MIENRGSAAARDADGDGNLYEAGNVHGMAHGLVIVVAIVALAVVMTLSNRHRERRDRVHVHPSPCLFTQYPRQVQPDIFGLEARMTPAMTVEADGIFCDNDGAIGFPGGRESSQDGPGGDTLVKASLELLYQSQGYVRHILRFKAWGRLRL